MPNFIGFAMLDSTDAILTGGQGCVIMNVQTSKEDIDMKKRIFLAVAILAVMLSLLALSSCDAFKKDAGDVWKEVSSAMADVESATTKVNMALTFYSSGKKVEGTVKGRSVVQRKDCYFYQEMVTKMKSEKLELDETTTSYESYQDGTYFISNIGPNVSQRLCSDMSEADAIAYRAQVEGPDVSELFLSCSQQTVTENEDGTVTVACSGYPIELCEDYMLSSGFALDFFGKDVIDMSVVIKTDTANRLDSLNMEFVFDVAENSTTKPCFTVETLYSQYNEAEREPTPLKRANFTEVEDVRMIHWISDMIAERQESREGSFVFSTKQTARARGEDTVYEEKDVVTYGEGEDGYYYHIAMTADGQNSEISYRNNKQTTIKDGKELTKTQREKDARAYIDAMINVASYQSLYVSNIQAVGDGVYRITCTKAEPSAYKAFFDDAKADFISASQTITITVENGQIVKMEHRTEAMGNKAYRIEGAYGQGTTTVNFGISLTVEASVIFTQNDSL